MDPVTRRLRRTARGAAGALFRASSQPIGGGGGLSAKNLLPRNEQAALLELEVVTTARGPAEVGTGPGRVQERVAALGGWLGAGLTGRAVRPLPLDQLAHLCAVLALLPEPAAAVHRTRWGCTAHVLAAGGRATKVVSSGTSSSHPKSTSTARQAAATAALLT